MKKQTKRYSFALKILLLFLWMGVIFYFSALPGNGITGFDLLVFLERKGAHVGEFFILALLIAWVLEERLKKMNLLLGWNIASALLYAVSDEFHQSFVFGRTAKWSDVGIDALGIMLAAVGWYLCKKKK